MKLIYPRIIVISALAIALVFNLVKLNSGPIDKVVAEEKYESVLIIPAIIRSVGGWENIELAKIQDLSEDSIFNEFNTTNSAFIASEEYKNLHSRVASASLSGSSPEIFSDTPESTPEPEFTPEADIVPELEVTPGAEVIPQPDIPSEATDSNESNESGTIQNSGSETEENTAPPAEVSEPSVFFRFLERSIFTKAWAQETDIVSNSYDEFISCDDEGAKCLSKSIEFSGFGMAGTLIEKPARNIQLRFSLAGSKENLEDTQVPGRIIIEYSFNNSWSRAGVILITDEVSNALNGGYFLYALPEIKSWDDLDSFKVRLSVQYFGNSEMNIFLDGLWLEADADYEELVTPLPEPLIGEDEDLEADLISVSASNSFSSYEIPVFSFDYRKKGGVLDLLSSFFTSLMGRGGVELGVVDQKTNVGPKIDVNGESFKIEFENSRFFVPGRHRLKIDIYDNGNEYRQEQEFLWSTLFINMEKTSYQPGETAKIYIEVLDDLGNPVCDAKIKVKIESALGRISIFSSDDRNIYHSGRCLIGSNKNLAGFYLNYQVPPETGLYKIGLSAETSNGLRILSDSFEVVESSPVEVIRNSPVNIVPGMEYKTSLDIKSDKDFDGVFKEIVPANFEIIPSLDYDGVLPRIEEDGYSRIIYWPISLKAGESSGVSYSFRALNGSSTLYVIGPVSLGDFEEKRSWQMISSDGDRSLMLNDNSVHSCKIEPFSQKVTAGGSVRYKINLTSSEASKPFILSFPDLPSEITASLNRATGMPDDLYVDIFTQPDTSRGSSNLVMVYQEREDNGAIFGIPCQFNLIVD